MNSPVFDFAKKYAEKSGERLHMPGHKGLPFLGCESLDITEIGGADSLYEASGIIAESEKNASELFGCKTFYSAEGSSLCIRAMLCLATKGKKKPLIAACRNAHKAFVAAAAMLDFDILWLPSSEKSSYLSCVLNAEALEKAIYASPQKPDAVYVTSPDYLGNIADIGAISAVCRRLGILLLVDNAHGAYLKFLKTSLHPIDLGADLCCDSAHKTLPVLTGGAYLHISQNLPKEFVENAKNALALFGSTSPSYLILQSLDLANEYLADYPKKLSEFIEKMDEFKSSLMRHGYVLCGSEPLKVTIKSKLFGYKGTELAEILRSKNVECEFADPDFLVLMATPESSLKKAQEALLSVEKKAAINEAPPEFHLPKKAMSIRCASLAKSEILPIGECEGKTLSFLSVGCPPAVPVVVSGETIDRYALKCFEYYGIESCCVVSRNGENQPF